MRASAYAGETDDTTEAFDLELSRLARELQTKAEALEPMMTMLMQQLAANHGGRLEGLEDRVKSYGSLKRKLADLFDDSDWSLSEAAREVSDPLRYTIVFQRTHLVGAALAVMAVLKKRGYRIVRRRNYWARRWRRYPYRGVNVAYEMPSGERFELQFHTPESWTTKRRLHSLYEQARTTPDDELHRSLRDQMLKEWEPVLEPDGSRRLRDLQ